MKSDETLNLDVPSNGFINLLLTLEDGDLIEEADKAMQKLVDCVRRRGGSGKLQLTVNIAEVKKMDGVHNVSYDFKLVEPKRERAASIMFRDRDNGLVTYKPEQSELNFERVDVDPDGKVVGIVKPKDRA